MTFITTQRSSVSGRLFRNPSPGYQVTNRHSPVPSYHSPVTNPQSPVTNP
ncbi:hypothetical protein [Sphaerospermopsis reniformis]|nr:hypothetical protein [Sphaerospermopsis reniformis]